MTALGMKDLRASLEGVFPAIIATVAEDGTPNVTYLSKVNLEKKQHLVRAAYDALPSGGALVAIENVIDDDRRLNAFGLLMSLNMLSEVGDGFDYTGADFAGWTKAAGFKKTTVVPLAGPTSAAIAYK